MGIPTCHRSGPSSGAPSTLPGPRPPLLLPPSALLSSQHFSSHLQPSTPMWWRSSSYSSYSSSPSGGAGGQPPSLGRLLLLGREIPANQNKVWRGFVGGPRFPGAFLGRAARAAPTRALARPSPPALAPRPPDTLPQPVLAIYQLKQLHRRTVSHSRRPRWPHFDCACALAAAA